MEKIKIGVSSCLLGENVRYDGGHKLDRFLHDTLGEYVEYVPVCPKMNVASVFHERLCIWKAIPLLPV